MQWPIDIKIIDKEFYAEHSFPSRGTPGSAGMDLRACISETILVPPRAHKAILIPTGFAIHMKDPNICAMILPRSGLGHKHGLILGNSVGLIDSDYQGQLFVSCWNRSEVEYPINRGDRIAQLLFLPILQARFNLVESFETTERGDKGYGSTGTN